MKYQVWYVGFRRLSCEFWISESIWDSWWSMEIRSFGCWNGASGWVDVVSGWVDSNIERLSLPMSWSESDVKKPSSGWLRFSGFGGPKMKLCSCSKSDGWVMESLDLRLFLDGLAKIWSCEFRSEVSKVAHLDFTFWSGSLASLHQIRLHYHAGQSEVQLWSIILDLIPTVVEKTIFASSETLLLVTAPLSAGP